MGSWARFSAMIPAAEESKETIEKAAYFLKTNLIVEDGELAKYLNKSPMESKNPSAFMFIWNSNV